MAGIGGSIALGQVTHGGVSAAQTAVSAENPLNFETFGAIGNGFADDTVAVQSALDSGARVLSRFGVYAISSPIRIAHTAALDLSGTVLRQAPGAHLRRLAVVAVSLQGAPRQSSTTVVVDGARSRNSSDVVGVEVRKLKTGLGQLTAAAIDCGTGVRITGQVEYARINAHAERCDIGVHLLPDGDRTPDELLLDVVAHDCESFFRSEGRRKMTGAIRFACEQSDDWGVRFDDVGWYELAGIIRACGKRSGGGLRVDGAELRGHLKIVGGSGENCEWATDLVSGRMEGLTISVSGRYANGLRVAGDVEGSVKLFLQTAPRGLEGGLVLGEGVTPLDGFRVEDGSRVVVQDSGRAIDLRNCRNCYLGLDQLSGVCRISDQATGNTISVPRKAALQGVMFENQREAKDNRILYRGVYSIEQLGRLNRGRLFAGMEAEMCSEFGMRSVVFDGQEWIAA